MPSTCDQHPLRCADQTDMWWLDARGKQFLKEVVYMYPGGAPF